MAALRELLGGARDELVDLVPRPPRMGADLRDARVLTRAQLTAARAYGRRDARVSPLSAGAGVAAARPYYFAFALAFLASWPEARRARARTRR